MLHEHEIFYFQYLAKLRVKYYAISALNTTQSLTLFFQYLFIGKPTNETTNDKLVLETVTDIQKEPKIYISKTLGNFKAIYTNLHYIHPPQINLILPKQ